MKKIIEILPVNRDLGQFTINEIELPEKTANHLLKVQPFRAKRDDDGQIVWESGTYCPLDKITRLFPDYKPPKKKRKATPKPPTPAPKKETIPPAVAPKTATATKE